MTINDTRDRKKSTATNEIKRIDFPVEEREERYEKKLSRVEIWFYPTFNEPFQDKVIAKYWFWDTLLSVDSRFHASYFITFFALPLFTFLRYVEYFDDALCFSSSSSSCFWNVVVLNFNVNCVRRTFVIVAVAALFMFIFRYIYFLCSAMDLFTTNWACCLYLIKIDQNVNIRCAVFFSLIHSIRVYSLLSSSDCFISLFFLTLSVFHLSSVNMSFYCCVHTLLFCDSLLYETSRQRDNIIIREPSATRTRKIHLWKRIGEGKKNTKILNRLWKVKIWIKKLRGAWEREK